MGLVSFWSCKEASRELAEERVTLFGRLHLLYCRYCRAFRRQLAALGSAARVWADGLKAEDTAEFEKRLALKLRG
jgi:hypothetical protein